MNKIPYVIDGPKTGQEFFNEKSKASVDESALFWMLRDKLDATEIETCFFTLCGLKCAFCYQDHDDATGIDTIANKADSVISYLEEANNLLDRINFPMLGGELFEDGKDYNDEYFDFCRKIKSYCDEQLPEKDIYFTFISNLGFNEATASKAEKLFDKLDKEGVNFNLSTSWDPTGRPMTEEIQTKFHNNLERFRERVHIITFILTRYTINKLLRDENPYFDYLYENFRLQFDYFTPNELSYNMMPSDHELYNVLTMFRKKYPKLTQIQEWVNNDINPISCASLSKVSILPDGTMVTCRHLQYDQSDFETPIENSSNANIIEKYVSQKECFSCEYFKKCTLSCFLSQDHKAFAKKRVLDECMYKKMFRDIEEEKRGNICCSEKN